MEDQKQGRYQSFVLGLSKGVSLLMPVMMFLITYEVVARYVFNSPTTWVWLICKQLYGVFVVVAGSYTLLKKSHIRIEMLYDRFPGSLKTIIRWLTLACAIIFLGTLTWKSGTMGLIALKTYEKATGVFRLPLYPLKLFIPLGTALFLATSLAVYLRGQQKGKQRAKQAKTMKHDTIN